MSNGFIGDFEVFPLDVGLLGAMAGVPEDLVVQSERLFTEYRGALAENYVAQQLIAGVQSELCYWRSKGGKAEIDFLCEFKGHVIPLEVKAGINEAIQEFGSHDPMKASTPLLGSISRLREIRENLKQAEEDLLQQH